MTFDKALSNILLIKKNRGPLELHGKLNGIGGKINSGELSVSAMNRECEEETELKIQDINWVDFLRLDARNGFVYCFYTVTDDVFNFKQIEDEELILHPASAINTDNSQIKANLSWIIPMAINHYKNLDTTDYFVVKENDYL